MVQEIAPTVRWQLRHILDQHNLTAYALARQLRGKLNKGSVYALARGETTRVDLSTIGDVLAALEALTGTRYAVGDLLAYQPEQQHKLAG